jgi:hypothetical protein
VAVVCGSESLSFAELNARANQLAHTLVRHGAGPDRLVGIYVERSVDMVVALLAVVKAGAAYLPLDPLLPPERLSYMLEDSGASLVVTQDSLRESLPAFAGSVISLDDKSWKANPRDNLAVAVQPDNLAYVIYTSGSTGKPKGVEVPRGALTNLLWSMRDWLGLTAQDRLLAVTTISFDIAGWTCGCRCWSGRGWWCPVAKKRSTGRACASTSIGTASPSCRPRRSPGGSCWRLVGKENQTFRSCARARPCRGTWRRAGAHRASPVEPVRTDGDHHLVDGVSGTRRETSRCSSAGRWPTRNAIFSTKIVSRSRLERWASYSSGEMGWPAAICGDPS